MHGLALVGLALLIWGQVRLLSASQDLPAGLVPIAIGMLALGIAAGPAPLMADLPRPVPPQDRPRS